MFSSLAISCGVKNADKRPNTKAGKTNTYSGFVKKIFNSERKRFKNDKPIEKIWIVGSTIANSLKQVRDKDKKGRELNQMVLEVTRSGEGKDSTYNFEQAFDEDDKRMRPIDWDEQGMTAEEYCQPPTEDEIDEAGYTDED